MTQQPFNVVLIFVLALAAGLLALDISYRVPIAAVWWRASAAAFAFIAGLQLFRLLAFL